MATGRHITLYENFVTRAHDNHKKDRDTAQGDVFIFSQTFLTKDFRKDTGIQII